MFLLNLLPLAFDARQLRTRKANARFAVECTGYPTSPVILPHSPRPRVQGSMCKNKSSVSVLRCYWRRCAKLRSDISYAYSMQYGAQLLSHRHPGNDICLFAPLGVLLSRRQPVFEYLRSLLFPHLSEAPTRTM